MMKRGDGTVADEINESAERRLLGVPPFLPLAYGFGCQRGAYDVFELVDHGIDHDDRCSSSAKHGAHFRGAVHGAALSQNLKAAQNVVEREVLCGVCRRHIVETQGARPIAGLLISRLAVPVAAAPLVLPISLQLSVQLRDDTGCPHPAWGHPGCGYHC